MAPQKVVASLDRKKQALIEKLRIASKIVGFSEKERLKAVLNQQSIYYYKYLSQGAEAL